MIKKFFHFFGNNFFAILIVFITVLLAWKNYTPGTWLTGWDSLHPEFNFPLNFQRLIFGVWREDQGLGALAGHSHMAELPRVIILYLLSFVSPLSTLRYLYIFLCLILGPLGVYFFIERIIFRGKTELVRKPMAFLGGIFYIFNLGTLQHFYVPFEMFTTQYAVLGWLFLSASKFLEDKKIKYLAVFSVATFFAAPTAYAATLFYAYFLGLVIYLFTLSVPKIIKKDFTFINRGILIIIVTLLINSFWILPNLYYLKTSASLVSEAKTNELFSHEVFLKNQKFGDLENTSILKNFLFDWGKIDNGEQVSLFDKWLDYYKNPFISNIGYLAFMMIILGAIVSIWKKEKYGISLAFLFLVSYFFLVGMNPPFASIYTILEKFPLFAESMRMPFTKFSILLMFVYAVFFAWGNYYFYNFIRKYFNKIPPFFVWIWLFLLIIYTYPFFNGELIGSIMKVHIPQEYFSAFAWFNKQENTGRIANFPSSSYAGWELYKWGFQGAGFFWFGEKMPVLARDFDRWNPNNENYYHEVSYALYSKNKDLLESILAKYNVTYILVDNNVISQSTTKDFLYLAELKEILDSSEKIKLTAQFGKLSIYKINENQSEQFISIGSGLPAVYPTYTWTNFDQGYTESGNYSSKTNKDPAKGNFIFYPFRSLFTGKKQEDITFKVEDNGNDYTFTSYLPKYLSGSKLILPEIPKENISEINKDDFSLSSPQYPQVFLDSELIADTSKITGNMNILLPEFSSGKFEIKIPKINGLYSYDSNNNDDLSQKILSNCDDFNKGVSRLEKVSDNSGKYLRISTLGTSSCLDFSLQDLNQRSGYLVSLDSRNKFGESMLFSIVNKTSQKSDLETFLPEKSEFQRSYFVLPPMDEYAMGYSLFFKNTSIGQLETVNDLSRVIVNPIPFNFLSGIKFVHTENGIADVLPGGIASSGLTVDHPNQSLYEVKDNTPPINSENTTVILSQSFDPGWKAYSINYRQSTANKFLLRYFPFFFGKEIKNHILVNNWENGWVLSDNNQTIIIIYLPQYLEFLGFILLLSTGLVVIKSAQKEIKLN